MAPGGQRRLIFTGNVKTSLFNKYTPGSGVGGLNASVRRNKYRRAATGSLSIAELEADYKARQNGTPITYPKIPCCPSMTSNPSNLAFPYPYNRNLPYPFSFTTTNSDTWIFEMPNYPSAPKETVTLTNGSWGNSATGLTDTLITGVQPTNPSTVSNIYFIWAGSDPAIISYITAISDSNNTITWTSLDTSTGQPYTQEGVTFDVITWTRVY